MAGADAWDSERWPALPPPYSRSPHSRNDRLPDVAEVIDRVLEVTAAFDTSEEARLRGCLPRDDSTFAIGLALYLAVSARGARNWVGAKITRRIDEIDDGALLDALDSAMRPRLRRTFDDRSWWIQRLPLLTEDVTREMTCAISETAGGADFSIVLQARLAMLGPVQIIFDGNAFRLDPVLHTTTPISGRSFVDLCAATTVILSDSGLSGSLSVAPLIGAWLDFDDVLHADTLL